jgi:hypothetical protein
MAIPSLSGQETAAQEHVAAQMERCGPEVDIWGDEYVPVAELITAARTLALVALRLCGYM